MNTLQETGPFRLQFAKPRLLAFLLYGHTRCLQTHTVRITANITNSRISECVCAQPSRAKKPLELELEQETEQALEQEELEHSPRCGISLPNRGQPVRSKSVGTSRKASSTGLCGNTLATYRPSHGRSPLFCYSNRSYSDLSLSLSKLGLYATVMAGFRIAKERGREGDFSLLLQKRAREPESQKRARERTRERARK